jgi:calpain-15
MDNLDENVGWERINGDWFEAKYPDRTLFGENKLPADITPEDIRQGYIGNCWIMAAISSVAEVPGRIDSNFVTKTLNDEGIYAVKLYSLGVPFTQIVDDYLPIWNGYQPVFANIGFDDSLWGALTEKVFAKWYGNYEHTIAGWMKHAVTALNGSPVDEFWHHNHNKDEIWNYLR